MFGAQDGVMSILLVVATVATATGESYAVLVSGVATAFAEVVSMAAGEYMSSKSQREIFDAQIATERLEVAERPAEAEAEVAFLLEREGLASESARRVAAEFAVNKHVLLKTMVEKELGLTIEHGASPIQGALILAGTFGVASLVPLGPFLFLSVGAAFPTSIALAAVSMFALGVFKSRFTKRNPLVSGIEVMGLVAIASAAGYVFGSILPAVLGWAGFHP